MKIIRNIFIVLAALYACCIIYALIPQKSIPVQELAGKHSQFINVSGRMLHYEKKGTGKPVILVHGFAGSTYTWRNVIPLLAQQYEVYAVDLLGFGLSDKPADGGYSLADQGQLIIAFIEKLKLQQPTIVGHSMGGVITALAAMQSPEKIRRLVLIDAGIYHGGPPQFLKYFFFPFDVITARLFYTKGARTRSLQNSYFNQSMITNELVNNYLKPAGTPGAAAVVASMNKFASIRYEDISVRLQTPTLLVWGRYDRIVPVTDAERLHKEIKGSQLAVIDDAGHMVQEEKPNEVASAIQKFLEQ